MVKKDVGAAQVGDIVEKLFELTEKSLIRNFDIPMLHSSFLQ